MKLFKKHYLNLEGFPEFVSSSRRLEFLVWVLVTIIVFILQTNLSIFGFSLNLTVLVPLYVGLKRSPEKGLLVGACIGLIEDSLSNTIIGPNILSKGTIGFLAPLLSGRLFIWTPLFGMVVFFIMTLLDSIIIYGCREIFFLQPALFKHSMAKMGAQALLNAPVGYFIKPKDE